MPQKQSGSPPVPLVVQQLLNRLRETGFKQVALTHTVYGRPRETDDQAVTAIPDSLFLASSPGATAPDAKEQEGIPRRKSLRVLRRLYAVVENLSDVASYTTRENALLKEYDVVSISPRNDATFQSACASALSADIITLDYASSRGGLPFKIRATDVKAAAERNVVFEIPYAAAVSNRKHRTAWVRTCREFQTASIGLKAKIIFSSSGSRGALHDGGAVTDVGPMALRSPGDLANLLQTVSGFDSRTCAAAVSTTGLFVLEQAKNRRFGKTLVKYVYVESNGAKEKTETNATDVKVEAKSEDTEPLAEERPENEEKEAAEDGFISFS
jgi:RNase P/RNase MRP subunit p30